MTLLRRKRKRSCIVVAVNWLHSSPVTFLLAVRAPSTRDCRRRGKTRSAPDLVNPRHAASDAKNPVSGTGPCHRRREASHWNSHRWAVQDCGGRDSREPERLQGLLESGSEDTLYFIGSTDPTEVGRSVGPRVFSTTVRHGHCVKMKPGTVLERSTAKKSASTISRLNKCEDNVVQSGGFQRIVVV